MKKIYLLLACLLVCTGVFGRGAQPAWKSNVVHPIADIRLSIGGPNGLYTYPTDVFDGAKESNYWKSDVKLADIYEPYYDLTGTPTFTAELNIHPAKFFYLGADVSWNRVVGRRYDPVTDKEIGYKKFNSGYVMGKLAIYWVQFPHCKIYSALYAGAEFRNANINGERSKGIKPAGDFSLFGAEWAGDVVFGFTEIVAGSRMNAIKLGIGYRF